MRAVVIIQARIGSTRLPGKVLYPLAGLPVLEHVVTRSRVPERVDEVVVAVPHTPQDDVVASTARRTDVKVYRGAESDVLGRMYGAALEADADLVVRICADNPLLSPTVIDAVIGELARADVDFVGSDDDSFPWGIGAEAFSLASFEQVESGATEASHREHVTGYYFDSPDQFTVRLLDSASVFEANILVDRTDVRLTLDEPADYSLLREVYENVDFETTLNLTDAMRYIDENDLSSMNEDVTQQTAVQNS